MQIRNLFEHHAVCSSQRSPRVFSTRVIFDSRAILFIGKNSREKSGQVFLSKGIRSLNVLRKITKCATSYILDIRSGVLNIELDPDAGH